MWGVPEWALVALPLVPVVLTLIAYLVVALVGRKRDDD